MVYCLRKEVTQGRCSVSGIMTRFADARRVGEVLGDDVADVDVVLGRKGDSGRKIVRRGCDKQQREPHIL